MDEGEYTKLVEVLKGVPDPRDRRGQRYPWALLVTLIAAALASTQPHGRAIGQWVSEHGEELRERLGWSGRRLPSGITLWRALRTIDLAALEAQIGTLVPPGPAGERQGCALDGKVVRGAGMHGQRVWLLGLADDQGQMLCQQALPAGQTELATAMDLVAGRDLTGQVVTADAAFTDGALAHQIRQQGGDYLFVVKANQPDLLWSVSEEFTDPGYLVDERARVYDRIQTHAYGHGRIETRTLEASTRLTAYLAEDGWPDVGRVLRRTTQRTILTTGERTTSLTYGITSLEPARASLTAVEGYWRGHWGIENRNHHVRDVSFREDAGQAHTGNTAEALAALRNGIITIIRRTTTTTIADALRHYAAHVDAALALIGAAS